MSNKEWSQISNVDCPIDVSLYLFVWSDKQAHSRRGRVVMPSPGTPKGLPAALSSFSADEHI